MAPVPLHTAARGIRGGGRGAAVPRAGRASTQVVAGAPTKIAHPSAFLTCSGSQGDVNLTLHAAPLLQDLYLAHDLAVEALTTSVAAVKDIMKRFEKSKHKSKLVDEVRRAPSRIPSQIFGTSAELLSGRPRHSLPGCQLEQHSLPRRPDTNPTCGTPCVRQLTKDVDDLEKAVLLAYEANMDGHTVTDAKILLTNARANLRALGKH